MSDEMLSLPMQFRTIAIDHDAVRARAAAAHDAMAADDERIPIIISTEQPVERPFGLEVLDHAPESIDLSRFARGLPLMAVIDGLGLVDGGMHTGTVQVGVVEEPSIAPDRTLRGLMRFSKSARAQEIRQDVLDGIRPYVSPGYLIKRLRRENARGAELPTSRAVRWMPFEVTIVPAPADMGAGTYSRSAGGAAYPVEVESPETEPAPEARSVPVSEQNTAAPSGAAPEARAVDVRVGRSEENNEATREIAALASQHAMTDRLPAWIAEGRSLDAVKGEIMTELRERLARGPVVKPRVELTEAEEKRYSFARAILSQEDGTASFERDVHEQIARSLPQGYKPQGGFFVPTNVRLHGARAGLDSGTSTKGSELKFVQDGPFIDQLRNAARVLQAGATMLSGLDGPVTMPKQNGAGTASWVGENPGSDVAESNLLLTTVSLAAKTLQSTTSFSRQLLRQAVVDVEALVRADIAAVHGLAIDAASLYGTGSSNQPQGIYTASGVGVVAIGTNGGAPTYSHMINLGVLVEVANAAQLGPISLITTPGIKGTLKNTQKFSSTNGDPVWGGDDRVAGMAAFSSNQVQSNLTKGTGTSLHAVYAGVFNQLLIGEFGAMELLTDPYRLKKQGMIEVTSFQMIDIAVRHGGAFAVIKDAISAY